MKQLKAKVSILFESKLYAVGDTLPTKNPQMVDMWVKAGSAVWKSSEDESNIEPVIEKVDAKPNITGSASADVSESNENPVGEEIKPTEETVPTETSSTTTAESAPKTTTKSTASKKTTTTGRKTTSTKKK